MGQLESFDRDVYERWMWWPAHGQGAIEEFDATSEWIAAHAGVCETPEPRSMQSPFDGRFSVRCAKAEVELDIGVQPSAGPRITYARIAIVGGPAPAGVDRLARRSLRLLRRRFDAKVLRGAFAESFRLAQMQEFAALARDRLGACRLGAVEARGVHAARYALDCERVAAVLELAVDPSGDPRITGYRIVPRPRVRHCAVQ